MTTIHHKLRLLDRVAMTVMLANWMNAGPLFAITLVVINTNNKE